MPAKQVGCLNNVSNLARITLRLNFTIQIVLQALQPALTFRTTACGLRVASNVNATLATRQGKTDPCLVARICFRTMFDI
jgi:hypothetical protein